MGKTKDPSTNFIAQQRQYLCSELECGKAFGRLANLRRHTEVVHERQPSTTCSHSRDELKYACDAPDCDKKFRKKKQLYDHRFQMHDREARRRYACAKCPAAFMTPSKLKTHSKKHDGYACDEDQCHFVAETWTAVRKHKAETHPRHYPCEECGKKFSRPSHLKKHQRLHEKAARCPSKGCEMKVEPRFLASHVRTVHSEDFSTLLDARKVRNLDDMLDAVGSPTKSHSHRLRCSKCGSYFAQIRNLRLHTCAVHGSKEEADARKQRQRDKKPHVCTVPNCELRFASQAKLEAHLNWHNGFKPFQCPEPNCDSRFSGRQALQKHTKSKHMKTLQTYQAIEELPEILQGNASAQNDTEVDQHNGDI